METLTPTLWTERDPTVLDGALAFDGDSGTFARVIAGTAPGSAILDLHGFPDGSVPPIQRTSAKIRILAAWLPADTFDTVYLAVSKDDGASYRRVAEHIYPAGFPIVPLSPGWVELDVTSLVTLALPSKIRVRIQFSNGDPENPAPIFSDS